MASFEHWLPYHPNSKVALTVVKKSTFTVPDAPYLDYVMMEGTARPSERNAFKNGEGVWWIRGHYDETTPEGQALLAAYALDRSAA